MIEKVKILIAKLLLILTWEIVNLAKVNLSSTTVCTSLYKQQDIVLVREIVSFFLKETKSKTIEKVFSEIRISVNILF